MEWVDISGVLKLTFQGWRGAGGVYKIKILHCLLHYRSRTADQKFLIKYDTKKILWPENESRAKNFFFLQNLLVKFAFFLNK